MEIAPGVFARSTTGAKLTSGLRVEVRDVEVAPGKTADFAFPGATILEIRSGKGTGRVAGSPATSRRAASWHSRKATRSHSRARAACRLSVRVYVIGAP